MECPKCKKNIMPFFGGYHMRRYGMCQECWEVKHKEIKE